MMRNFSWARAFGGVLLVACLSSAGLAQDAEPDAAPDAAQEQPAAKLKPGKKPAAAAKKPAAPPKLKVKNVGSWVVTCAVEQADACSASLQMVDQKRKLRLLTMSIGRNAKGALLLEAVTPTGVMIAPGVTMQAGKIKLRSPYVSCADAGCMSRYAITESMLAALKTNTTIKFTVMALPNNVVNIEAKPKGTGEVLGILGQ